MELKVKASRNAMRALKNFMFESRYEYECRECRECCECSENDKIEQIIADIREDIEEKFAEAEEDGKKVLGCKLKAELITIDEDDTPFDVIMEIAKSAYEANDIGVLKKISELVQEALEDEEE